MDSAIIEIANVGENQLSRKSFNYYNSSPIYFQFLGHLFTIFIIAERSEN